MSNMLRRRGHRGPKLAMQVQGWTRLMRR
jgi:hypothetical protein